MLQAVFHLLIDYKSDVVSSVGLACSSSLFNFIFLKFKSLIYGLFL